MRVMSEYGMYCQHVGATTFLPPLPFLPFSLSPPLPLPLPLLMQYQGDLITHLSYMKSLVDQKKHRLSELRIEVSGDVSEVSTTYSETGYVLTCIYMYLFHTYCA